VTRHSIKGLLIPAVGPLLRGRLHAPDGANTGGMVLVDPGATWSVVDREVARQLGLPTHGAAEWRAVGAAHVEVAARRRGALELGEDRRRWSLDLIEANISHQVAGYTVIALLGWDFLARCRLGIDGPGRTFELELPRRA
jgi:predicted aspartyl protease